MNREWTVHEHHAKAPFDKTYTRTIGAYDCVVHFNFLGWKWYVTTSDRYEDSVGEGGPMNLGAAKAAAYKCAWRLVQKSVNEPVD
jgi:hypothetical protein